LVEVSSLTRIFFPFLNGYATPSGSVRLLLLFWGDEYGKKGANEPMENREQTGWLYPNPATDQVNVFVTAESVLEIINLQGKTLIYQKLIKGYNNFSVSQLSQGYYIVKVNNYQGNYSLYKLIIIR
jgi:type IX secretion system substrate protein